MKTITNSLEPSWERIEGTKEGRRVAEIKGHLEVQLTDDEIQAYENDEEEVIRQITIPLRSLGLPNSVLSVEWNWDLSNDSLIIEAEEVEAEEDFP
jgi:hypothetical protein